MNSWMSDSGFLNFGFQLSIPVGFLVSFQSGVAQSLQCLKKLPPVLTGSKADKHVTSFEWDCEIDNPCDLTLLGIFRGQAHAKSISISRACFHQGYSRQEQSWSPFSGPARNHRHAILHLVVNNVHWVSASHFKQWFLISSNYQNIQ